MRVWRGQDRGEMAEWSKALVLGARCAKITSLSGGVGSNPTLVIPFCFFPHHLNKL